MFIIRLGADALSQSNSELRNRNHSPFELVSPTASVQSVASSRYSSLPDMDILTDSPMSAHSASSLSSPSSKSDLGYESEPSNNNNTCSSSSSILLGLLTGSEMESYKSRSQFLAPSFHNPLKRTRADSVSSSSSSQGEDSASKKSAFFSTPPKKRFTFSGKMPAHDEIVGVGSEKSAKRLKTRYVLQWEGSVPKLGPQQYDPECTPTSPHLGTKLSRQNSPFQPPLTPVRRGSRASNSAKSKCPPPLPAAPALVAKTPETALSKPQPVNEDLFELMKSILERRQPPVEHIRCIPVSQQPFNEESLLPSTLSPTGVDLSKRLSARPMDSNVVRILTQLLALFNTTSPCEANDPSWTTIRKADTFPIVGETTTN